MGSAADRIETVAAPHGWGTGRGGGISGRSQRDNCCSPQVGDGESRWDQRQIVERQLLRSPWVGDWERRGDQRQIVERQLLLPTGGGLGEEVGSAVDRRGTTTAPHRWGTGRGGGIAGRS